MPDFNKIYTDENELSPYKKKKKKKTPTKSNHKHNYKPFIGKFESEYKPGKYDYMLVEECETCGKIIIKKMFLTYPIEKHISRMVSCEEEVREHFPEYEIKEIENPFNKQNK